jgi:hypothetical protein
VNARRAHLYVGGGAKKAEGRGRERSGRIVRGVSAYRPQTAHL